MGPGAARPLPPDTQGHRRQRQAALGYDATSGISTITCPTLILHGRRDRSIPLRLAEEMQALIPGAQLTAFRGSHMFSRLTERPRFVAEVNAFLDAG